MATDPKNFHATAAKHADRALTVAAEIMDDPELSPAVRLEAGKWLTKVANLEPKTTPQEGGEKFSIIFQMGSQKIILNTPSAVARVGVLDQLLNDHGE